MKGEVKGCVVSYHKGKYELTLLVDTKLHMFTIRRRALVALSSGAAHALGDHIGAMVSKRRKNAANQRGQNAVLHDGANPSPD